MIYKKIDNAEDEEDLKGITESREDIRLNGTVLWEEIQKEIKNDVA